MRKEKIYNKALDKTQKTFLDTIGNNLYALRVARKESLKAVAKAVNMSPSTLSKIEKGLYPHYRVGTLIRLSKYYKVHPKDIVSKGKIG